MEQPTASMLAIGDELLSGRTQDANMHYLAIQLTKIGINFCEVRFIRDDAAVIASNIVELSTKFDYLFTSGGIGPTHDDITTDCVAEAFGRQVSVRSDAFNILKKYYDGKGIELNEARLRMARIPEKSVSKDDKVSLGKLEENLKRVIFGQDDAIEKLVSSIVMSRAGLGNEEKPIGSFLFAGPTGVGKTELSRQLSLSMGVELIRFDMSEYMERHTVSRLIGAPPGYVGYDQGGLLTEAAVKNPHSVILLDEIEKAHPEVFNVLLQVMDHGTLTDNNGRVASFKNVVLIMTTNSGAQEMARNYMGFQKQDNSSDGVEVIKKAFSPEFRNRLDAIVQFDSLPEEVILTIVDKFLTEVQAQLDEKQVTLEVDDDARVWLSRRGYDEKMGARPMYRIIQDKIKKPLAEELIFGELSRNGGSVIISVEEDELKIDLKPSPKKEQKRKEKV